MRSEGVDCERNSAIRGAAENAPFSGTSTRQRAWLYWLAVVVASEEKLQLRKGNMFKGAKRKVGGRNSTLRILRTHYGYLGIGGSAGTGRTGRFQPSDKFRNRRDGTAGPAHTAENIYRRGILAINPRLGRVGRDGFGLPKNLGIGGSAGFFKKLKISQI